MQTSTPIAVGGLARFEPAGAVGARSFGAAASFPRADEVAGTVMHGASESDWMAGVERGDKRAFRAVVERYESQIVAFCVRFLGDASAARDIAQEVFLTLWDQRRSYRERGKLRLYLLRIARLRCLAALKQQRSRARLARRYADEHAGRAHAADAGTRSDAERVRLALARLRPEHAELIVLRHLEGLDLAEIAEVTGLRLGTVKSRLSRGLAALRGELADVETHVEK